MQQTAGGDLQKILYLNPNFSRKYTSQNELAQNECQQVIKTFSKYDTVLVPFFTDFEDEQRCSLVCVTLSQNKVDLFDREREIESSDVSDVILSMLTFYNRFQFDRELDEEDIDGGVEEIQCEKEEDMLVSLCYVAERTTYGFKAEVENVDIEL
jgi:hypothetical protein